MTDNDADKYGSDITQYSEVSEPGMFTNMDGTPFMKRVVASAKAIDQAREEESVSAADAAKDVGTQAAMLAWDAYGVLTDPIGYLAGVGLSIVLDLCQPLDDLLHMVGGNDAEMQAQIDVLAQVETALNALDEEITADVNSTLTSWEGAAADAASDELGGLSASARAVAQGAQDVARVLDWARMIAVVIFEVIKAILTELVAWAITRGLVALATSVITAGASVVTFLTSAAIKAIQMLQKALGKFRKAVELFEKLITALRKIKVTDRSTMTLWKEVLKKAGSGVTGAALQEAKNVWSNLQEMSQPDQGHITDGVSYDSFAVSAAELTAAASALEQRLPNVEAIAGVAAEAGAAEMTWGLTGFIFEQPFVEGCAGLVESIGDLAGALEGEAAKLRGCAEDYSATDDAGAAEFAKLLSELKGG